MHMRRLLPSLRNDAVNRAADANADEKIVNQLVRFGRRPLVHVAVLHGAPGSAVRGFVETRVAPAFVAAGIDVHVQYSAGAAACELVFDDLFAAVLESPGDFFVVVAPHNVAAATVLIKRRGCFATTPFRTVLATVWKCWPQNPAVNLERVAALTSTQQQLLLAHYCRRPAANGPTKMAVFMSSGAHYAHLAAMRDALVARPTAQLNLEKSPGQRRAATYDPQADATVSAHVKDRLLATLDAALRDLAAPMSVMTMRTWPRLPTGSAAPPPPRLLAAPAAAAAAWPGVHSMKSKIVAPPQPPLESSSSSSSSSLLCFRFSLPTLTARGGRGGKDEERCYHLF